MSPFTVDFTSKAIDELGAISKTIAQRILDKIHWMANHFEDAVPVALSGDLAGIYKLRVGDYRVLYTFDRSAKKIRIQRIRHRRDVYRNL